MRCFIHIVTDTEFLRDWEGEDFSDQQESAQELAQVARDLMAEELRKGNPLPVRWKVLLALADDTILMSLPFSQLIPATAPLTRRSRPPVQPHDAMERKHLAEADRHLMQGHARVEAQKLRIAKMQERGYDTSHAEDFLNILITTLKNFASHRDLILQALPHPTNGQDGSNRRAS